MHIKTLRGKVSERDLEKPEANKINDDEGSGITGPIQSLGHHHANALKDISVTNDLQRSHPESNYIFVLTEDPDDWF